MNIPQIKRSFIILIISIAVACVSVYLLETFSVDIMAILLIVSVIAIFYAVIKLFSGLVSSGKKDAQPLTDDPALSHEQASSEEQRAVNMRSLINTAVTAVVLCALFVALTEALALGIWVVIGLIVLFFRQLSRAGKAKNSRILRKQHIIQAGIYFAALVLCVLVTAESFSAKDKKTRTLIAACENYKSRYGKYPDSLAVLVPEFIGSEPSSSFRYTASEGRHLLITVTVPPFGRKIYNFEEKKITTLD